MEQVTATISDGNDVLVDGVIARVEITTSPNGRRSWHGSFVLPQGSKALVGGPFMFETHDGRSGQIIISRTTIGSHQATQVEFTGTGPFA